MKKVEKTRPVRNDEGYLVLSDSTVSNLGGEFVVNDDARVVEIYHEKIPWSPDGPRAKVFEVFVNGKSMEVFTPHRLIEVVRYGNYDLVIDDGMRTIWNPLDSSIHFDHVSAGVSWTDFIDLIEGKVTPQDLFEEEIGEITLRRVRQVRDALNKCKDLRRLEEAARILGV